MQRNFRTTDVFSSLSPSLYFCFLIQFKDRKNKSFSCDEDRKFIQAAQKDPQNFRALYEKYYKDIHRYFFQRLENRDLAEEYSQEVFLRAFLHLNTFVFVNVSYKIYLLRVAHNILLNHFRRKKPLFLNDFPEEFFTSSHDMEKDAVTADIMWRSLMVLSKKEEKVFCMRYQEGLTIREISVFAGVSENAIKLLLSRSRKKIRAYFGP